MQAGGKETRGEPSPQSGENRRAKLRSVNGGPPTGPSHQQIIDILWQAVTLAAFCVIVVRTLGGPKPNDLTQYLPALGLIVLYFLLRNIASIEFDQGTILGGVVFLAGAFFLDRAITNTDPELKDFTLNMGIGLTSLGLGIIVGQRIPRPSKSTNHKES